MIATLLLSALVAKAGAYAIDPATCEAGFELSATMHTVRGTTTHLRGEVRVEPAEEGALALSGRIEIDAASLATGNDKRDATMHGKSFEVVSFPSIVFAPERFAPKGPPGEGGATAGTLTGELTIRGKTTRQEIAAVLTPKGDRIIAAAGTFDVTWADFGVPDPSFFVIRIAKTASAHFRAEFVPAP